MTYRVCYVTPTELGGYEGGHYAHRVYDDQPTREEQRELRRCGWRLAPLDSGHYANTSVARRVKEVLAAHGKTWLPGLVWVSPTWEE